MIAPGSMATNKVMVRSKSQTYQSRKFISKEIITVMITTKIMISYKSMETSIISSKISILQGYSMVVD